MVRELRSAVIGFGVVFFAYGLVSSSYLASFGFTYEQDPLRYVAFSTAVHAGLGVLLGMLAGLAAHALGRALRAPLTAPLQLAFHLVAATGLLCALHVLLRTLSGYVFLHWSQSERGPQLVALLAVGLVYGSLLLTLRLLLARRRRGGLVLAVCSALLVGGVGISLVSHLGLGSGPVGGPQRNAFVISIDTLRADYLPAYGHPAVRTPALDEIARDGVVFDNAYSTSPFTWPSISSILTGRFTLRHGVRRNGISLGENETTIVELFQQAGYRTTANTDIGIRWTNWDQGFDRILKDESGLFEVQRFRRMMPFLPRFSHWFVKEMGRIHTSLPQTLSALRWLRTEDDFERAFFWFHYYDDSPHAPYTSPEPYHGMHVPPDNRSDYDGSADFLYRLTQGEARATPDDRERIRAFYAAKITWCDKQIGALVDELKRRGLYESSTIVVFSDHGEMFGRRDYYTHGEFLYNELLHVPLIIKPPRDAGFRSGVRVEQPVSTTDIFPTLAAMYDLPEPDRRIDGQSLVPFLEGKGADPDYRFWHYAETLVYARAEQGLEKGHDRVGFAVMTDGWKSISVPNLDEYHLYRLDDVEERENLADRERVDRLARDAVERFGLSSVEGLLASEDGAVPDPTRERLEALGYIVE